MQSSMHTWSTATPPLVPIAGTKIVLLQSKKVGWLVMAYAAQGLFSNQIYTYIRTYVRTYVQGQAVVGRKERRQALHTENIYHNSHQEK